MLTSANLARSIEVMAEKLNSSNSSAERRKKAMKWLPAIIDVLLGGK